MASTDADLSAQGKAAFRRTMRVLVVDDERDTVVSLLAVLRHEGYEAMGVYDGRTAIRALEEFQPDAVLVDIAMEGMTGWDVAREVRKKFGDDVLLIAITGAYVRAPDEILARVAGFNQFMVKPCDPNTIIRHIEMLRSRQG